MHSDDAFASPILDTVRGKEVSWSRIRNDGYGTLENLVRQSRLSNLKFLLDECSLAGRDRFNAMAEKYTPWVNDLQVAAFLQTSEGARKAAAISLKESGVSDDDAKEIINAYLFPDLSNMVMALAGFVERIGRNGERPSNGKAEGGAQPVDPTGVSANPSGSTGTGS